MKSMFNYRDPQFLREHIQSIINFYHPPGWYSVVPNTKWADPNQAVEKRR
jgi:hypothetical protein